MLRRYLGRSVYLVLGCFRGDRFMRTHPIYIAGTTALSEIKLIWMKETFKRYQCSLVSCGF